MPGLAPDVVVLELEDCVDCGLEVDDVVAAVCGVPAAPGLVPDAGALTFVGCFARVPELVDEFAVVCGVPAALGPDGCCGLLAASAAVPVGPAGECCGKPAAGALGDATCGAVRLGPPHLPACDWPGCLHELPAEALALLAAPPAAPITFVATLLIIIYVNMPGSLLPCPPVRDGLSPMRVMMASIFLAVRVMATINMSHGTIPAPDGMVPMTLRNIFRKMTFRTIIRHIVAYIRTQPLKISAVFLLPPIAKAHGASIVSNPTRKYRSPTARNSFTSCPIRMKPTMMTSSHEAFSGKNAIRGRLSETLSGIWSIVMTVFDIPSPMLHICLLASKRKPNTKVRAKSVLGSSPSKPSPEIMLFAAWNTRLPSSSAHPVAIIM